MSLLLSLLALFPGIYDPPDPMPADRAAAMGVMAKLVPSEAAVERRNGVPVLVVDGRPVTFNAYKGDYDYRMMGEAGGSLVITHNHGSRLYASVKWDRALWNRRTFDFSRIEDNLLRIHAANPEAKVILNISVDPDREFLEAHPDAIFTDDAGKRGRTRLYAFVGFGNEPLEEGMNWAYSYVDSDWIDYVNRGLAALGEWLRSTPAGNIVIGFQISGGMDGQFVQWEYRPAHGHFDYSEGGRRALCRYLREVYGSDDALRKAWNDNAISLDTAENPTVAEFKAHPIIDDKPGIGRRLADCRRFIAVGTARTLNGFARTLRRAFGRKCIVETWWTTAIWAQPSRLALDELIADGAVDVIGTVSYYGRHRQPGGAGASANNLAAALDMRNVLYIQELDYRTRRTQHVNGAAMQSAAIPSTSEEFECQVLRDAGSVLAAGGHGFYFFDMFGSWYHEPEAMAVVRKAFAMNSFASGRPRQNPEVALVLDELTRLLAETLSYESPNAVWRTSGVTPAMHLLSDLQIGKLPRYRLILLWHPVSITRAQTELLRRKAEEGGCMVVAAGAVGVSSRDFASSEEALSALGPKVIRIASVKDITPARLNELARSSGAHVYCEAGNAVYVGNGVAVAHRLSGAVKIDFGREVIPVDPLTGRESAPLRVWQPEVNANRTAAICFR